MNKLLLVDGNALMHRAYHAIPTLTTSTGEQVNAIFGFTSILLRALADLQPTYIAVAFDLSGPTFRHKLSTDYKATRQKMDEDLARQIPRLKEVVRAFDFPIFELKGFEADDLIGTLATQAHQQPDLETYIMTADMDAAQLVNDRTSIYTAKQKISEVITYNVEGITEKYNGLTPSQIIDYKALRGDTSDNIPGVPGIGEKTAIDLLKQYQTLDNLYQNLENLKPRTKELLQKGQESAYLSKRLATISLNAPISLDLNLCHVHQYSPQKVRQLFQELEFRSLISRLPDINQDTRAQAVEPPGLSKVEGSSRQAVTYHLIDTTDQLAQLVKDIRQKGEVALDTETTGLDTLTSTIIGVSCAINESEAYYIPFGTWSKPLLKGLLEDPSLKVIAHNAKFDAEVLHRAGIELNPPAFDTMLAAYILKEGVGKYGLKELAFNEFGIVATPITDLIGTGKNQLTIDQVDQDKVTQYAAADADHTWRLYQKYSQQFASQPELQTLFQTIEMPTSAVLTTMEENGILLDTSLLNHMSQQLADQLENLEKDIYAAIGHQFNLNSPKQLAEVLFDELKLPAFKKTKTGRSTDESVLQGLKGAHPAIELLLRFRELFKLKSTYVDALPDLVNPFTGRLHTSYNQAIASTGRLSSTNPNLQNIPIRTEAGRQIRQAFLPNPDHILASLDYSQVELRILAHVSGDPALQDAFASGQDIHAATAAKVFNCDITEVTPSQRRAAKTINFGIMYGQSAHGLSIQLGITRNEAEKFIHDYFGVYTGVKDYLDQAKIQARQQGYVQSMFGRRRRIPELASPNFQLRQAGERMAINMPIQGTAADIIKRAMIQIHQYLQDTNARSQMLLQVHDELVFTVDPAEQDTLLPFIKNAMQTATTLTVPLIADAKIGPNWNQMTPLSLE